MAKVDKDTEQAIDNAVEEIQSDSTEDTLQKETVTDIDPNKTPAKRHMSNRKKKLIVWGVLIALLAAVIAAVPFLRYGFMGVFVHKNVAVTVLDDTNGKPVSGVNVTLDTTTVATDKAGAAHFSGIAVGEHAVKVQKKYYNPASTTVLLPITGNATNNTVKIKATGRTVSVQVSQAITGQPLSDATVMIGDTSAISDSKGIANVVVGVGSGASNGTVKLDKYADATFVVDPKATDDQTVAVKIVPAGRVYYLSKATGIINVMSANLDGSKATVALQGTGKENDQDTMLMASSDWKYVAVNANRDGHAKPYLLTAADNSLVKIDDDDGTYQMVGWTDTTFVYMVNRNRATWQPGQIAIKAYDTATKKLTVIDESQASGSSYYDYQSQGFTTAAIAYGRIIYGKNWYSAYASGLTGKNSQLVSAQTNGVKSVLKEVDATQQSVSVIRQYSPVGVYVSMYSFGDGKGTVYDLNNNKVTQSSMDENTLNNATIPADIVSPSGTKTAWHDTRDGKNYIFTGDANGKSAKQLPPVGYKVYGWFTDDYLLLTKEGSELFVYPADGSTTQPLKVTDYHKPATMWPGIGYGAAY